jgi:16S rRNA C1402 (ribose-2'-O) methylase RsmI
VTGFGRLLSDLNAAGVRYVVIGGIAVIRHGVVRATRDVDVVVASDERTAAALDALRDVWKATRPDGSA